MKKIRNKFRLILILLALVGSGSLYSCQDDTGEIQTEQPNAATDTEDDNNPPPPPCTGC